MAKPPHLRLTAWPGSRVEPPPVLVVPCHAEGEWLVYDHLPISRQRYEPVPDQAYLFELSDVDGEDPFAVAELVGRIGRLTPLHDLAADLPPNAERAIAHAAYERGQDYNRGELAPDDSPVLRVHLAEAAYRIQVLRALTCHALAYRRGRPVVEAWRGERRHRSEAEAWRAFTGFANPALRPFHVRVYIDNKDPDYDIGQARPSAYEVAILQLVNDLATDAEFKVCAAEGCGRSFARQRDRSTHYNRSTGVVYCSRSCANAQAQREWRRRQRAQKGS